VIRWIALSLFVLAGCASEPRIDLSDTRAIDAIPAVGGNRVGILRDGAQTFPAMFAAMARARDSINLEYFTFDDVRSGGRTLEDLLTDRLRHGVAVSILYDAYGSNATPPAFLQRLARAGAALTVFNPNPVARGKLDSPNDRDHRKIMVIDGLTAFVGGINLDHVYENQPPYAAPPDDPAHAWWRDTAARIDGPVVADLQRVFFDTWTKQKGAALPPRVWFPAIPPRGSQIVRVIPSVPGEDRPLYYVWLLHALRAARQSISLSTGYFVPTHQEREELTHAARRGVRVRLVLPGRSDSDAAIAAGHAAYGDLLEAGARIYEVQNAVLHSKFVVIDGLWTAIGSSNIDRRSATFNNEIDAVIQGSTAAEAEAVFDRDVAMSKEIDLRSWRSRPLPERLREWRARLWEFLL
jgi:cardiolipin synthase